MSNLRSYTHANESEGVTHISVDTPQEQILEYVRYMLEYVRYMKEGMASENTDKNMEDSIENATRRALRDAYIDAYTSVEEHILECMDNQWGEPDVNQ